MTAIQFSAQPRQVGARASGISADTARPAGQMRLLHTMLRVRDLDLSLAFYVEQLGMTLRRRQDFPDGRFTLAFVGYAPEAVGTVLELTYNWDGRTYSLGDAFGHLAIEVNNVHAVVDRLSVANVPVTRAPGPLSGDPSQLIAFVRDPDGYPIELIQRREWPAEREA